MAKKTRELTSGTIWTQIVSFAIPLLLASLIQLLYNFVKHLCMRFNLSFVALLQKGTTL